VEGVGKFRGVHPIALLGDAFVVATEPNVQASATDATIACLVAHPRRDNSFDQLFTGLSHLSTG